MSKEKKQKLHVAVMAALNPLIMDVNLVDAKIHLDKMFTKAVENADDDEIDNYSARELSQTFKALSETILHLNEIPEIREMNSTDFSKLLSHE